MGAFNPLSLIAPALSIGLSLLAPPTRLPDAAGPRVGDLSFQRSDYGVQIPDIWGMFRLPGNYIWTKDIEEEAQTSTVTTGKGGGPRTVQNVTNYSYFGTAASLLCRGPAEFRRIWLNSKLVFDRSQSGNQQAMNDTDNFEYNYLTLHTGTSLQGPDGTISAAVGYYTPAYRYRAYLVYRRLPLADYGNRPPSISAEMVVGGQVVNVNYGGDGSGSSGNITVQSNLYVNNDTTTLSLGYSSISSFTSLTTPDGYTVYTNGTDYTVNTSTGTLTIPSGSAIRTVFGTNPNITVALRATFVATLSASVFRRVDPKPFPLNAIVADLCGRAGLPNTSIDPSDLESISVRGFVHNNVEPARNSLETLSKGYPFDVVESSGALKFVRLWYSGKPITTLTADALGAHDYGTGHTPLWTQTRTPQSELPAEVRVRYSDWDRDFAEGSAYDRRLTQPSTQKVSIDLTSLALTGDEATNIARRSMYLAWAAAVRYDFALAMDWIILDPGDLIEFERPVDDSGGTTPVVLYVDSADVGANFQINLRAIGFDPVVCQRYDASAAGAY